MTRPQKWIRTVLLAAATWIPGPLACAQGVAKPPTYPKEILIVRHGEKPPDAALSVHLNEDGQKRAEALPELFEKSKKRPDPFPKPDFLFAASDSKNSHRPTETIAPLAKAFKLSVNAKHSSDDPAGFAQHLLSTPKLAGKVVLVSWRHTRLPELVKALGVENGPTVWKDEKYDRVWVIEYDEKGKATFHDKPQHLMPGDSKK